MSRSAADAVVVVEVAAEALLVGEAGDPHDHRVAELAAAEELERGGLAAQLVERVVEVGEVLDLRHRQQADVRGPLRDAEDRGLVEQRVEDARRTEAPLEPVRQVVDTALAADVLAEEQQLGPSGHLVGECGVDAAGERPRVRRRRLLRQGAAEQLRRRSVRVDRRGGGAQRHASGWNGASGAMTSAVRRQARSASRLLGGAHHAVASVGDDRPRAPPAARRRARRGAARCGSADRGPRPRRSRPGSGRPARRRTRRGPRDGWSAGGGRPAGGCAERAGRPRP